jgi:hypothetical protein
MRHRLAQFGDFRLGGAAAILDTDPDSAVVELPADPYQRPGQRLGVPERIAEQLTDHERRVTDGGLKDSGGDQVRYQATPDDSGAGRRKGEK